MKTKKLNDIILAYVNNDDEHHERKIGRYYASEISSIEKGYLTPKTFFQKKKIDLQSSRRIASGRILETGWEEMMNKVKIPHIYNPKYEIQQDDFIIVCKPDFVFDKFVVETKFPATSRDLNYLLSSYQYQLEAEYQVTKKPVYLGKFSMVNGNEFNISFYPYTNSEIRWKRAIDILSKFHHALIEYENLQLGKGL